MVSAVAHLAREAGWHLAAILRPRRFFVEHEIAKLYKSCVLSYLESGAVAYSHATKYVLAPLDRTQSRLLRELGLSEIRAFEVYRLAPLCMRRDIGMMGLLHRISLGLAPSQLSNLFPISGAVLRRNPFGTRLSELRRHNRQFVERARRTDVFDRSVFGIVKAYNLLPQQVVDIPFVPAFQGKIQKIFVTSRTKRGR